MGGTIEQNEDSEVSWVVFLMDPGDFGLVPYSVRANSLSGAIKEARDQWQVIYNIEWFYGNEELEGLENVEDESFILTPHDEISVWKVYKDSWINDLVYENAGAIHT